jgi:hypothetical protein
VKYGIVILALGYELYGSCAYNLALSIKANDTRIRVCILHDTKSIAHLTPKEKEVFDILQVVPEDYYMIEGKPHYFRAKLLLNKLTPFEFTMYMDADNIWIPDKKVSWLLGEIVNDDFTIGNNGEYLVKEKKNQGAKNYPMWEGPEGIDKLVSYWNIQNFIPQTVSGFIAFRKCEQVEQVFHYALKAYDDPKAPGRVWVNGKSDEYCFNIALAILNVRLKYFNIFYFDRMDGNKPPTEVYEKYWGIATGGHKVSFNVVNLYNRLVNKYSVEMGMPTRHYHVDKTDFIPERDKY